ncbi:MAG: 30S ribosomal protein S6 [Chloroflexi bacterium]|nr:30S ribosomal protein S6 [Chloroflexota bacterium]
MIAPKSYPEKLPGDTVLPDRHAGLGIAPRRDILRRFKLNASQRSPFTLRYYELMWILGSDTDEEGIDQSIEAVDGRIENHGGTVLRTAAWGRRSLAYPINHHAEGIYNVVQFDMEPEEAVVFEKEIVADQAIIRHLHFRIEEADLLPAPPPAPPAPPEPAVEIAAGTEASGT